MDKPHIPTMESFPEIKGHPILSDDQVRKAAVWDRASRGQPWESGANVQFVLLDSHR